MLKSKFLYVCPGFRLRDIWNLKYFTPTLSLTSADNGILVSYLDGAGFIELITGADISAVV